MKREYPHVYLKSFAEAHSRGETQMYEDSFRHNVSCARAIEQAIRNHFDGNDGLDDGCAQAVLEEYGFKRVKYVLADTIQNVGCRYYHSDEVLQWGKDNQTPSDGRYSRYVTVDTAACLLDAFIGQFRQAYQALGLFDQEHCDKKQQDYTGKVLIMHPNSLKEGCWSAQNQLWFGETGVGLSPTSNGQAVSATCLSDGEQAPWNRSDFIGVLDEQYLPEWAAEKLAELRGTQQEQQDGPSRGSMEMR